MTSREKAECLLIAVASGGIFFVERFLPKHLPLGEIILAASIVLLGQGLLRDLWIKYVVLRPQPAMEDQKERPRIVCMCMESTIGVLGVLAGGSLLLAGIPLSVELPAHFWPALLLLVASAGFLIKDLVFDWKSRSIRKEKDHQNVIFW